LIEAIDELRTNGLYHGNLNLNNTYYEKGSALLKLGNFREKGKYYVLYGWIFCMLLNNSWFYILEGNELVRSQLEDWDASGTMIKEIADILKNANPGLELWLMEDLSHFLKNHGYVDENSYSNTIL
jgi:hypothetical protein